MNDLPLHEKLFFRYLGPAYAVTYWAAHKTFLGAAIQGWIKFMGIALFLGALVFGWGESVVAGTAVFLAWVYFSFWRAKKAGYSKFIPDAGAARPSADLGVLRPYNRIPLLATGVFNVIEFDKFVLLRSAEYWQAPLGQHIVMVEHKRQKYLYQFFNAHTLRDVQSGWLIFGAHPLPTLAVSFNSPWGENGMAAAMQADNHNKIEVTTVYFSFLNQDDKTAVLHNILHDIRAVREG